MFEKYMELKDFEFEKNIKTPEQLQDFWFDWISIYKGKENIRFITDKGQVICNMYIEDDGKDALPVILYNDGYGCKGLPRSDEEIASLGYRICNNSMANFIHEAIHLFLEDYLVIGKNSVLYNQSIGKGFNTEPQEYDDAVNEEMIVVGFQVYLNGVTDSTVKGFQFFLANADKSYALSALTKRGLDVAILKVKFIKTLLNSNKGFRCS